jgi:hypothetical protein
VQNNKTAHNVNDSIGALDKVFGERGIRPCDSLLILLVATCYLQVIHLYRWNTFLDSGYRIQITGFIIYNWYQLYAYVFINFVVLRQQTFLCCKCKPDECSHRHQNLFFSSDSF